MHSITVQVAAANGILQDTKSIAVKGQFLSVTPAKKNSKRFYVLKIVLHRLVFNNNCFQSERTHTLMKSVTFTVGNSRVCVLISFG